MRQQTLERQLVSASACSHPISFEDLCVRAGVGDIQSFGPTDRPSCGHTLQCWASIFLSAPQITRTSLYQLIAGGPIIQAFNNANVVLHAARHMFESMSMTQLPNVMLALARGYCQSAAISGERRLRATLMEEEHACDLPRVLFCSMSWVTVQRGSNHQPTIASTHQQQDQQQEEEPSQSSSTAVYSKACTWEDEVFDHEFAIVKRRCAKTGLLQFQLVQGYSASGESDGFGLVEWQQSRHRFASVEGFGRAEMLVWLDHFAVFAHATAGFDADNFRRAFGVSGARAGEDGDRNQDSLHGRTYWPALSYRELLDESIIGFGERPLSDQLETGRVAREMSRRERKP